jgi:predicted dehydrogenase
MTAVRLILVGLGARSQFWLRVIANEPDVTLVAMADPDQTARDRAQLDWPSVPVFLSLAEAVQSVGADAVLLSTPPSGRQGDIEGACGAGLAILAEKPLADSVAEAARFVERCEVAGIPLMVGLNFRYLPVTIALRGLFSGPLGRPSFARFTYERWRDGYLPHINKYPLTMAQPMLWEQSIHHFDLMRYVYDSEPVEIFAKTFNPPWSMYADDANVSALITFANGVVVNYQGTWAANWGQPQFAWRSECANGIALQRDQFGALGYALRGDPSVTDVPLPAYQQWIDDAALLLRRFVLALKGEIALECTGRDHLKSLQMVQASIISSQRGEAIDPAGLELSSQKGGRPDVLVPPATQRTSKWQ